MSIQDWRPHHVKAENVGIVTRALLDRLIEKTNNPDEIWIHPETKLADNLVGVRVYADLLVIRTVECPIDSVYVA